MSNSRGHHSMHSGSASGAAGDIRSFERHGQWGTSPQPVVFPPRRLESGSAMRHGRFLSGERADSAQRPMRHFRESLAALRLPPPDGTGTLHYEPEARGTSQASAGSSPFRLHGLHDLLEQRGSSWLQGSAEPTHGSLLSQGRSGSSFSMTVPRGVSPFAAASATGVAMRANEEGRTFVSGRDEPVPSVAADRQATRVRSPATFGDPDRLLPQPASSADQRLPAAATEDSAVLQSQVTSKHTARRQISVSSGVPRPVERQAGRCYPSTSFRGTDNACAAGADHRHGSEPFLSTSRSAGGAQRNAMRYRVTHAERRNPSPGYFGSSNGGPFIDALSGEGLAARMHRSVASSIRSFLSAVTSPLSLDGQWGEVPAPIRSSSMDHGTSFRRVFVGPGASLVVFGTSTPGPRYSQSFESEIGHLVEELEHTFNFGDPEGFETPVLLLVSNSDFIDSDEGIARFLADAEGTAVSLRQVYESRDLRTNLERHTIRWTFGSASGGSSCTSTQPQSPISKTAEDEERSPEVSVAAADDARRNPTLITQQSQTQNGKECCICLNCFEAGETLLTLRCLHIFHAECLDRWIKISHNVKCPLCSTKIAEPPTEAVQD